MGKREKHKNKAGNYWLKWVFWRDFLTNVVYPWIRLMRLSNLLTVAGDTMAGAFLTSLLTRLDVPLPRLLDVIFSSILFYTFGMVQNDICDFEEDRRHRPERPLASGEISQNAAIICSVLLLVMGLLLSYLNGRIVFFVAVVLCCMISVYNLMLKSHPMRGAVCMGLCRSLNMLMGASLLPLSFPVLVPIVAEGCFIMLVTQLSFTEHRPTHVRISALNIISPIAIGWLGIIPFAAFHCKASSIVFSFLCVAAALAAAFFSVRHLYNRTISPERMQHCIGALLGCLIPWQASLILLFTRHHHGWLCTGMLLAWGLYLLLGKKIHQS